jgi:hypothetical protein
MAQSAIAKERRKRKYKKRLLKVFALTDGKCFYCGHDAENRDHVIPVAKGGPNESWNMVPACQRCNAAKGDHTIEEFRQDMIARAARGSTKQTILRIQPFGFQFYFERVNIPLPTPPVIPVPEQVYCAVPIQAYCVESGLETQPTEEVLAVN